MDFFDAAQDIRRQFPSLEYYQVAGALDREIGFTKLTGRNQYARKVEMAHGRILEWLRTGSEYEVNPGDLESLMKFVTYNRPSTVWAVLSSHYLKQDAAPATTERGTEFDLHVWALPASETMEALYTVSVDDSPACIQVPITLAIPSIREAMEEKAATR